MRKSLRALRERLRRDQTPAEDAAPGSAEQSESPVALLSVVVPLYNVEDYVAECLDSLLGQDYRHLQIIVVDDGSTDSSRAIVETYAQGDERIEIVTQSNAGLGAARNRGVQEASGDYLTFVDSDDIIPAAAYQRMIESLEGSGSDVAVGQMTRIRAGADRPIGWARDLHHEDRIGIRLAEFPKILRDFYSPNKVYRTDFWRRHALRFREGVLFEDQPLITDVYLRAGTIDVLRAVTYKWRKREDSLSFAIVEPHRVKARRKAIDLTRDLLEGQPAEIIDAWRWTLVDDHLPNYLAQACEKGDVEFDGVVEMARDVVSADQLSALADCSAENRVMTYLALVHGREAVLEFCHRGGRRAKEFPVRSVAGGSVLALPMFQDSRFPVPDELFAPSEDQLRLHTWFSGARWIDERLEITGRAFIEFLDRQAHANETTLILSDTATHDQLEIPCTVVEDEFLGPHPSHWHLTYPDADFRAEIDGTALCAGEASTRTWSISVRTRSGSVTRTAPLHAIAYPGLENVIVEHSVDGSAIATVTCEGTGPQIQVRRHAVLATGVELTDSAVRLKLSDDTVESVTSVDWLTKARTLATKVGPATYQIDLDGAPEKWRLEMLDARHKTKPLFVSPELAEVLRTSEVELGRGPFGGQWFMTPREHPVITAAEVTDKGLAVTVSGLPETVGSAQAHLLSERLSTEPSESVAPIGGEARLLLPFRYSEWGEETEGVLPLGEYRVVLLVDGEETTTRISQGIDIPPAMLVGHLRLQLLRRRFAFVIRVVRPFAGGEPSRAALLAAAERVFGEDRVLADAVFFQCLRGEVASDSQLAIHRVLRRRRPDLRLIWGVNDYTVRLPEGAEPVLRGSEEWLRALAESRWICVNHELPSEFRKQAGQVVIQTYHGHPFKSMGLHRWRVMSVPSWIVAEGLAARSQWDYLVAPSPLAAQLYQENFPIEGLETLQIGHPRNDALLAPQASSVRQRVRRQLGVPDDVKLLLYAPTWRDNTASDPWKSKMVEFLDPHEFAESLGDGYRLLLRGHPAHQRHRYRAGHSAGVIDATDYPEINDLILASDAGVFDYSSIRFDYGVTGKPMIFYVPDEEHYLRETPGLFEYAESAPGPRVHTADELRREVLRLGDSAATYRDAYGLFNQTFNARSDGHSAERLVDRVFGPETDVIAERETDD
ncbi:bifunctional glycosyltransferase/CDP-glycerol:glycerophosphate glycerophosphotransferase [Nocardioides insulae]|uniref:bifunctional glycosyltransferase/CDP-glycerol:glycerophosphate glycerophosphotransferase n=1 Tax=Nocardioides insulae TaxID=394734 RepID=UPI000400EBA4|nr:CDP-glycerol glycerophosphotransferase family protein [Nocardioides insulae]